MKTIVVFLGVGVLVLAAAAVQPLFGALVLGAAVQKGLNDR